MLGYTFLPTHTGLRKRTKKKFAKRWEAANSPKRKRDVLAAYYGWCKWGDCRNLFKSITSMSFSEMGITPKMMTKDGKRFLDAPTRPMMSVINTPIRVLDFETDIMTRNGGGRYAVLIETVAGERVKVITNSASLKSVLDQAREQQQQGIDVLPQSTVVHRRELGNNKYDYYFE